MRPWTRWWWLGSAVDEANLTRLLEVYQQAGLGGVEITPIYGVQGQEARDIPYLSDRWLAMLRHTLAEARRLGLGVDMPTGTGWPFGGPNVTPTKTPKTSWCSTKTPMAGGQAFHWTADAARPQALTAVSGTGRTISLLDQLTSDGALTWTPPPGDWTLYAVTQMWAGRVVKRAAPGAAGQVHQPLLAGRHYATIWSVLMRPWPSCRPARFAATSMTLLSIWRTGRRLCSPSSRRGAATTCGTTCPHWPATAIPEETAARQDRLPRNHCRPAAGELHPDLDGVGARRKAA